MDFFKVLEGRASVRAFLSKPVDKGLLKKILKAASHSPSFMNTQPWEVFVVLGEKKKALGAELFSAAQEDRQKRPDFSFPTAWPQAPEKRSTTHRLRRFEALGIDPNDQVKIRAGYLRNFQFYGAPCVVFVGLDKSLTSWSMFDLGLFVQSFLNDAACRKFGWMSAGNADSLPRYYTPTFGYSRQYQDSPWYFSGLPR